MHTCQWFYSKLEPLVTISRLELLQGSSDPWEQTQKNFEDDTQIVKGLHPGRYYEMRVVSLDGDYKTYSKIEEVITSDVGEFFQSRYVHII